METKQVLIIVHEAETERRRKAEAGVTRLVATYAGSILAEVNEAQSAQLASEGFQLEPVEQARRIRLRSMEFDPVAEAPVAPAALSLRATAADADVESYWIVQFIGPVKPEWPAAVQAAGGTVGSYIPENAFLVRMTSGARDRVAQLDSVRWIGPYHPVYKISPLLMGVRGKIAAAALPGATVRAESFKPSPLGNLRVVLHRAEGAAAVRREIEGLGGAVLSVEREVMRISLDPAHIAALAALDGVEWLEPYAIPRAFNDVAGGILGVQPLWNAHGLDGEGQIVGVADTGLDTGVNDATMHHDLAGRIVAIHSWAVNASLHPYLNNTSWDDGAADLDSGHGTHVSGSVLGNGAQSGGGIRGMAYNSQLVLQAVEQYADVKPQYQASLPSGYYLIGIPDALTTLFQQSYNDGARVLTNSWGGDTDASGNKIYGQYTTDSQYIDEFTWGHKDAIILYAAGNSGIDSNSDGVIDADSLNVQATAKNCITVGASENNRPHGSVPTPGYDFSWGFGWPTEFPAPPISTDHVSNNPEGMAAFSSRGPADDGRIKPDVVAPGTNILSVRSSVASKTGWGLLPVGDTRRNFYMFMGGTSQATPLTAGATALIRQYVQNACLHNPTGALLKALLIHGAAAMTGQYTPSEAGTAPNSVQGWGRVNLEHSLFPAYPAKLEFRDDAADAVGTGDMRDYSFKVADNSIPLRATLAWTDYPATPTAGGLVNQLRLSVVAPDATVTQGAPSDNNVQQVVLTAPQTGTYTVRVTGINVPTASMTGVLQKQDFALVLTAGLEFVDVYIKDNAADDGVPPSTGVLCESPDIWVSLTNDPLAAEAPNPEYGQTNYVFVRVHNRGSKAADNAEVKLYWANPGTNLSKPYWNVTGIKVDGVDGNVRSVNVPAHGGVGDGEAITASFEWTPPDPAENTVEPGHFCLFATVSHPEDPILQEDVDKVRWEDNLAWKNEIVKDVLPDSTTSAEFYVAGIPGASIGALSIDSRQAPGGGQVTLKIPSRYLDGAIVSNLTKVWESPGGEVCQVALSTGTFASLTRMKLKSRENTAVRIEVTLPPKARPGDVYPLSVEQQVNGRTTGRVNMVARIAGTPAYIANCNPESLEIHLPNCSWVPRISGHHKVPYNDLKLALRRGYNGCRFCLPEYSTD